jgi:hypothetical protein
VVVLRTAALYSIHIYRQTLSRRAARAIRLDLPWKGLGQNCFGPANIGIGMVQQDRELPNLQFRVREIFYIVDWARAHLRNDAVIGSLQRAFNCSRRAIHLALANGLNEPKSRGRHSSFGGQRGI